MGNAHATIVNKTPKKVCVITFDQADLLYKKYNKMYIIDPGCSMQVEVIFPLLYLYESYLIVGFI